MTRLWKWIRCELKNCFSGRFFPKSCLSLCLQHTFVRYTQPYSSSTVELIITFGNLSSFASVSHTPTMFCCKAKVATPHYVHWPNPNKRWFLEGEFFAFWERTYSRRPKTQEETRLNHPEKHTKHSSNGSTTPVVWQQIVGGKKFLLLLSLFGVERNGGENLFCFCWADKTGNHYEHDKNKENCCSLMNGWHAKKNNFQLKTIKSKD